MQTVTIETAAVRCRLMRDGSPCLLNSAATAQSCCVCDAILTWRKQGYAAVLVREVRRGAACYVFPVTTEHAAGEQKDCLLKLPLQHVPLNDVRGAIDTLLSASPDVWIYEERGEASGPRAVQIRNAYCHS